MEVWKDLIDFPNYQVSTYGRVRNCRNNNILKPSSDRYGYLRLSIGSVDNVYIHKLVCKTFIGESQHRQTQINHIDCNRQNNRIENLEYCSGSHNIKWAVSNGNLNPSKAMEVAKEKIRFKLKS